MSQLQAHGSPPSPVAHNSIDCLELKRGASHFVGLEIKCGRRLSPLLSLCQSSCQGHLILIVMGIQTICLLISVFKWGISYQWLAIYHTGYNMHFLLTLRGEREECGRKSNKITVNFLIEKHSLLVSKPKRR